MAEQIRLRLTGNGGSGVCELMEQAGRLRYRLTLQGDPCEALSVLLQGRSPHMEDIRLLAKLEHFAGQWQTEGDISAPGIPGGWLWVLRGGKPWLMGLFPGVTTPTEAARRLLRPAEEAAADVDRLRLMIPIPGLVMQPAEAGHFAGRSREGKPFRAQFGPPESDPYRGSGMYWASGSEKGLWICWDNQ